MEVGKLTFIEEMAGQVAQLQAMMEKASEIVRAGSRAIQGDLAMMASAAAGSAGSLSSSMQQATDSIVTADQW